MKKIINFHRSDATSNIICTGTLPMSNSFRIGYSIRVPVLLYITQNVVPTCAYIYGDNQS